MEISAGQKAVRHTKTGEEEQMSCWRRTTVLRIPAIALGFVYSREWEQFLEKHEEDFNWEPRCFAEAMCDSYEYDEYSKWLSGKEGYERRKMLSLNLYPETVKSVPGPFLDYYLDEVAPLSPEENTYHENDSVRPLTQEEKVRYLPLYRKLFPDFTLENMDDVHYCHYEWYDGAEAPYMY